MLFLLSKLLFAQQICAGINNNKQYDENSKPHRYGRILLCGQISNTKYGMTRTVIVSPLLPTATFVSLQNIHVLPCLARIRFDAISCPSRGTTVGTPFAGCFGRPGKYHDVLHTHRVLVFTTYVQVIRNQQHSGY